MGPSLGAGDAEAARTKLKAPGTSGQRPQDPTPGLHPPRSLPTQGASWEKETTALSRIPALCQRPCQGSADSISPHPHPSGGLSPPQFSGPHVDLGLPLGQDLTVAPGPGAESLAPSCSHVASRVNF